MGLLDDAIRQHLELKRQHGASDEELQRQEEEALGPARRDVAPAEASGGDGEVELETAAEEEPAAAAAAPDAHEQETALHEPEGALQEPEGALPEIEREPAGEPPPPYDAASDVPAFEQEDEVTAEEALEPPSGPEEELFADEDERDEDEPPLESHEDEDEDAPLASDPDAPDADVLEDTPDFLQETPEHDRLWFEQKPPRDFDFD